VFVKVQELQKAKSYWNEAEIWKMFIQTVFALKKLHDLKIFH